ncbi:hypothetical protein, partial [Aeromonas caviae]
QAGKWDQETIVSFFLCQYCSGEYLPLLYPLVLANREELIQQGCTFKLKSADFDQNLRLGG